MGRKRGVSQDSPSLQDPSRRNWQHRQVPDGVWHVACVACVWRVACVECVSLPLQPDEEASMGGGVLGRLRVGHVGAARAQAARAVPHWSLFLHPASLGFLSLTTGQVR